jgi:hypothetical protein
MKTPRDLLLERHRHQAPALDQLRERVVAQELVADPAAVRQSRTGLQPVSERTAKVAPLRDQTAQLAPASNTIGGSVLPPATQPSFVAPAAPAGDRLQTCPTLLARLLGWLNFQRVAWSGFAALWCVILGLNLAAEREMGTEVAASGPTDSAQFLAGLQENRAQLAALLFDEEAGDDATDHEPTPGPRSDAGRIRQDARHLSTAFV